MLSDRKENERMAAIGINMDESLNYNILKKTSHGRKITFSIKLESNQS